MSRSADATLPGSRNPLWWRVPAWTVITAVSVAQTHGLTERVATGALMALSAVALQFVQHYPLLLRRAAVLVCTAAGLAACFTGPQGLAEILVVVVAGRAPFAFGGRALTWFTVLDTLAFGATVGLITHSVPGLLAGLGVPLLVQRAVEHRDLVRERDRAGHAVYRAVQEALTNAARYAPGGTVHVRLSWEPSSLSVTMLDTGPGVDREAAAGVGTGLGLAGMGERLVAVGGAVRAGPDGAGWRVTVDVPRDVGAPVPAHSKASLEVAP